MKELKNGLLTGLTLQLAVGPVFFYIISLALRGTMVDGFAGVLAVTLVDYFYISLAVFGIGKLLENKRIKRIFGIVSPIVLILFGLVILKGVMECVTPDRAVITVSDPLSGFVSVFLLTISSPMTIIFFTSLFAAKALENNYSGNQLLLFGLGTGLATFLFMGSSVIVFSLIKNMIPAVLIMGLNAIVGFLLIGYGSSRLLKPGCT